MPVRLLSGSLIDQQIKREHDSVRAGVRRYRKLIRQAVKRGEGSSTKAGERLLLHWYEPLRRAIVQEKRHTKAGKPGVGRSLYGPAIITVDAGVAALITMRIALGHCLTEPKGARVNAITSAIGRDINAEAQLKLARKDKEQFRAITKLSRQQIRPENVMRVVNKRAKVSGAKGPSVGNSETLNPSPDIWPLRVRMHLGAVLLWHLIGVASIKPYTDEDDFIAAFVHKTQRQPTGKKWPKVLVLTDQAIELIEQTNLAREHLHPRYRAMVVPPLSWDQHDGTRGGYLRLKTVMVKKSKPTDYQSFPRKVFGAIDALGRTPWQINKRILDVAQKLIDSGGNVAGIPRTDPHVIPSKPEDIAANPEAREQWRKAAGPLIKQNHMELSVRMAFAKTFAEAKEAAQHEAFYFPHQLDFTGRCYPMPIFNHQGDDLQRGLLQFATSGRSGNTVHAEDQSAIAIHLANCCGIDKASFGARELWVEANHDRFARWRSDPLKHNDWFTGDDIDKPFQALAAAYALDDPQSAACLPIQIDGTCNVLQHYAALARDKHVAGLVNLLPADAPHDLYSVIASHLALQVERDAEYGDRSLQGMRFDGSRVKIPVKDLASLLLPIVDRKLVKSNTMTHYYNVTDVGARKQLHKLLKDSLSDQEDCHRYMASLYLVTQIKQALAGVCESTEQIMNWLAVCGGLIARTTKEHAGQAISWLTPMGMLVTQPYHKTSSLTVRTLLQWLRISHQRQMPPSPRKQVQGLSPNWIHSLDACHMMQTALECEKENITFAGVHDGFWTHAATAGDLGVILRQQFVKLHEQPLVEDLHKQFKSNYQDVDFPLPPEAGSWDIADVLKSPYAFS